MIKENDVREAIAEMQGQRNPNADTCIKLAAYYTILDHIAESPIDHEQFSYSGADPEQILYEGDSEFAKCIETMRQSDVWPVIDELMTTLQAINPRLYDAVIRKLE